MLPLARAHRAHHSHPVMPHGLCGFAQACVADRCPVGRLRLMLHGQQRRIHHGVGGGGLRRVVRVVVQEQVLASKSQPRTFTAPCAGSGRDRWTDGQNRDDK